MDRREKSKRKPRHKSSQRLEKRKTERHRSPHRHQSGVQDVFTIEAANHPDKHHSRSAVQKLCFDPRFTNTPVQSIIITPSACFIIDFWLFVLNIIEPEN
ncbi:hypothetical protein TNCV_2289851 [Trichonephila clavipes]|uniref:Uncharacterized protein n=1 Tax=Trichonephila clavipes TaxID=2585209 RepID=A0A8X6RK86_TRICX|nr:hypothetical protein TNCV_2289851 [Trichonephila clavipes]